MILTVQDLDMFCACCMVAAFSKHNRNEWLPPSLGDACTQLRAAPQDVTNVSLYLPLPLYGYLRGILPLAAAARLPRDTTFRTYARRYQRDMAERVALAA